LNCFLYGAVLVQTVIYVQIHRRDALWIKFFVYYLLLCETLNTGCDIATVYEPLIIHYGTPQAVEVAPTMLAANPLLTVMVSTPVLLFLARRVKIISHSSVLCVVIISLAIASFGGGVATMFAIILVRFQYAGFHQYDIVTVAWLASSAAAYIVITASLAYNLMYQRTGLITTDNLVNKIVWLTVQTGLITSVVASIDLGLFIVAKSTALNFIFDFCLSKLYSNSLLSTLNARGEWNAPSTIQDNVLFRDGICDTTMQNASTLIELETFRARMGRSSGSIGSEEIFSPGSNCYREDIGSATISLPQLVGEA